MDAYHSASTSFKKLEGLIRVDKESQAEDAIDEITNYVEKMHNTKKSKSALDLVSLQSNLVKDPVRIYIDGGFDLIHSGHYNAIR